jgi:hypothetical protein
MDELHPRHIDLGEDIAFGAALRPYPALGDPVAQLRLVEADNETDHGFEADHDAIPRRGS